MMRYTIISLVCMCLILAMGIPLAYYAGWDKRGAEVTRADDRARTFRAMADECRELKRAIMRDMDELGRKP
jgi:hypothetical protein